MIAVIDYGMGNLGSVGNALEALGAEFKVTSDAGEILKADKIILPGVGAFSEGMENLKPLIGALGKAVLEDKKPYLGICLGMQFLAENSQENGQHRGLGWIKGDVELIKPGKGLKVPHMGWNDLEIKNDSPIFKGLEAPTFYFVHSFHFNAKECITGTTYHGTEIIASVQKGNIFGVQFHPEKSQAAGLMVLKNFMEVAR